MCGRFALTLSAEDLAELFSAEVGALPPSPRYNVCPTQDVAVVVAHDGSRHVTPMRWGLIPRWAKAVNDGPLLINARAETIAEKPAFRDAARKRRCLVPASGFYEWTKAGDGGKDPWYIAPAEAPALALAGVWQAWTAPEGERLVTVAIVTTAAEGPVAGIHHRVPVVVEPADWPLWLGEDGTGAAALMRAPDVGALRFHRVARTVNRMTAQGAELIEPVD